MAPNFSLATQRNFDNFHHLQRSVTLPTKSVTLWHLWVWSRSTSWASPHSRQTGESIHTILFRWRCRKSCSLTRRKLATNTLIGRADESLFSVLSPGFVFRFLLISRLYKITLQNAKSSRILLLVPAPLVLHRQSSLSLNLLVIFLLFFYFIAVTDSLLGISLLFFYFFSLFHLLFHVWLILSKCYQGEKSNTEISFCRKPTIAKQTRMCSSNCYA